MLLEVDNLRTHFRVGRDQVAKAVDGVSFQLAQGKTLALVGESGCGKSQTAFSIMRLIAENGFHPSGNIRFDRKNLSTLAEDEMRVIRGNDIAMIFQEPMTSLNPLYRIGNQLEEPLRIHRMMQKIPARKRAIELLDRVGIPDPERRVDDFPHQLSGGMKQRVMIAMALSCEPKLLIADEPTTALDTTVQAQILELLESLRKETDMAILLITHNLGIVAQYADRVAVMYAGKIIEEAPVETLFESPAHPYTRGLLNSLPKEEPGKRLEAIPGTVPYPGFIPEGCAFHPRCAQVMPHCKNLPPPFSALSDTKDHQTACWLYGEPDEGNS